MASAQHLSLENAISTARTQSVAALETRQSFISTFWAYRSYKASRLPSFNLYGNVMNFDRSLTLMQSYEDGSFTYVNSYNLQNSLGLQVIRFTNQQVNEEFNGVCSMIDVAIETAVYDARG